MKTIPLSSFLLLLTLMLLSTTGCKVYYWTVKGEIPTQYLSSHLLKAQEYKKEGKLNLALEEYELHLKERLADKKRPKDENPYFYKFLIGDIYMEQNQPLKAKEAYLLAKQQNADKDLFIDRWRKLAQYYSDKGNFETALKLLNDQRDTDPLLFDGEIDTVHKQMIATEDGTTYERY